MTECTQTKLECKGLGRRRVEAQFTGERISSDGGGLLLGEADARIGLLLVWRAVFKITGIRC